ncbi:MAG TPA: alpha/beta hydrolase [Rhodocyclaceae bacterium]|nr:alpha/beta hydrolase [Rhodocyclaceae bacterium]
MRSILGFVTTGVAIYLAIVVLMYVSQSRQVYFPVSALATTPAAHGMAYEDVHFVSDDGLRLHGWFVPADEARGVVLFFHGNAGNVSHRIDSIRIFRDLGLSVFIIDYRGYGHSEGRPSEAGTYRDAQAAWRHLRDERGIAAGEIVVFGRSLGAAVAAWLAAREAPAAVILESVFTSAPDLGAELMPWLPIRLLLRFQYDTRAAVREIRAPLLVIHSRDDEIVPFRHGRAVFEAANEPKMFVAIEGGHNDGFLRSLPPYERALRGFLDAWL